MIHLIPIYRANGRLTFDNGIRSCRRDDPRRNPLSFIVLSRSDWTRIDGDRLIVYGISKLDPIGVHGVMMAARLGAMGMKLASHRLIGRLQRFSTLQQARRYGARKVAVDE